MPVDGADPVGCDIELTKMVMARLGVETVEFILTTFGELIDGVRSRRWHLNTPMFITKERAALIEYSLPVWAAIDSFIIRSDDSRDFVSYEAIASDDTIRLAAVTGQIQLNTAIAAGVPPARIVEFADQDSAAQAVLSADIDASVSTAPGNFAYLERLGDPRLVSIADSGASKRGGAALGAFSFHKQSHGLAAQFNAALDQILGTPSHLRMMNEHGFDSDALKPALTAGVLEH